jgi:hypothetical protein
MAITKLLPRVETVKGEPRGSSRKCRFTTLDAADIPLTS